MPFNWELYKRYSTGSTWRMEISEKMETAITKLESYRITTIHYFWKPIETFNLKCLPAAPHFQMITLTQILKNQYSAVII